MFRRKKEKPKEAKEKGMANELTLSDLYAPDGVVNCFEHLVIGARLSRVYAVAAPPRVLVPGWLDELLSIGDVDVSVQFYPASDARVVQDLIRRETRARAQYELDARAGNIARFPELEQEIADYRALREQVQLGLDRIFHVSIFISVSAQDEETFQRRCEAVENVFARRGAVVRVLAARQKEGLASVLPLAAPRVADAARNMTSGAAMCCLPITAAGAGVAGGVTIGENLFTASPVRLARFAGERVVANPHLFVSGETGSGKSVTVRYIALLEAVLEGVATAFVDPEGEYAAFTGEMGGQVIRLAPGRFSGINPLDLTPDESENPPRLPVQAKVEDVAALLRAVYHYHAGASFSPREAALVEEAVREAYRAKGIHEHDVDSLYAGGVKKPMPTLSDVHALLREKPGAEAVADAMKPLLAGGSLGMFDGQTTVAVQEAPFLCISLRRLDGDFPRFVGMLAAFSWLWQTFAQKGGKSRRKCVAVDEAWMFLRYPGAAFHLENLARRGRKHGCGLTVATQRFEEFAADQAGRAVIESCASVLVLRQEEHAVDSVVNYFRLAAGCRDILSPPCPPGRGILRTAGMVTAVQVRPAPFELPLVETKLGGEGQ